MLVRRLELFAGMFTIPNDEGTIEKPIQVPSEVSQHDFDSLLEFIYGP
jgi:hypothetical protein